MMTNVLNLFSLVSEHTLDPFLYFMFAVGARVGKVLLLLHLVGGIYRIVFKRTTTTLEVCMYC